MLPGTAPLKEPRILQSIQLPTVGEPDGEVTKNQPITVLIVISPTWRSDALLAEWVSSPVYGQSASLAKCFFE